MGRAQRDDGRAPQHLEDGRLGDRQVGQILEGGRTRPADDLVELFLDGARRLGVVEHEHDGPLEGRFDGFHAG